MRKIFMVSGLLCLCAPAWCATKCVAMPDPSTPAVSTEVLDCPSMEWSATFDNGMVIRGVGAASHGKSVGMNIGDTADSLPECLSMCAARGCWCKVFAPYESFWVFMGDVPADGCSCAMDCAWVLTFGAERDEYRRALFTPAAGNTPTYEYFGSISCCMGIAT